MSTLFVQTNTLYLAGSGVVATATSATLPSFSDIYGNVLTMTNFGSKGYITFEPDTTNEEAATFTGITANANGTYTLTGLSTTLAVSPYTESSGLVRGHVGGTKVVVTDNVAFWNTFGNKNNAGTWSAVQTFSVSPIVPTGGSGTQAANNDDIANAITGFTGKATNLVAGTTKLSVAAVSGSNPIAVGDNDPRMTPATGTSGGILGYTSSTAIASSVLLTTHALVIGGGAGATPTPLASLGTTTTVLHGNASGDPTFGAISLTADVSGILPVANGGTGSSGGPAIGSTSNTSGGPSTSTTQTITHGLGRTPVIIRTHGYGSSSSGSVNYSSSSGTYTGNGNKCAYVAKNSTGTSSSGTFSIFLDSNAGGGNAQGVIGNVTSTTFDIVWTISAGSTSDCTFIWETQ